MRVALFMLMLVCAIAAPLLTQEAEQPAAAPAALSTWGYVESLDGLALTLDDGTVLQLPEGVRIVNLEGAAGTLADITAGLRALVSFGGDGTVQHIELLPPPAAPETYLCTLTTWGANVVSAQVGERIYPRSLATTKASFTAQAAWVSLRGAAAYQSAEGANAPAEARFTILNAASEVLYDGTLRAGETVPFRLNFAAGSTPAFTLVATPVGEATLRADWCLWLDPHFVAQKGAAPSSILQTTVRRLLDELRQAIGEQTVGPMAVAQFGALRVKDNQAIVDLQEDLVVQSVGAFTVAGKLPRALELGAPLPDDAKQQLNEMGAKCVLVGMVSDRGSLLVVSAALVNVETGEITATARAVQ